MALSLALLSVALGIHPDGHWNRVTKLGQKNFESEVRKVVDDGKTMMVRFIASPG